MSRGKHRTVLFLDDDAGERGRLAESLFNSVAARMGLPWQAARRGVAPATNAELEAADLLVVVDEATHRPLVERDRPALAARAEYWRVAGGATADAEIEREVMGLVARLLGGKAAVEAPPLPGVPAPATEKPAARPVVRVGRETKGRRGKGVTIVSDLPLDAEGLRDLAARLKQRCGTGGTVRDGQIEIQGDQRDRLTTELESLGYRVKRVGG